MHPSSRSLGGHLRSSLLETQEVMATLEREVGKIEQAAQLLASALSSGNKLLVAGNGGSAADAQHFTAEFEGRFLRDRRGFPALCFCSNPSFMTGWSNDYSFDTLFERQLQTYGCAGDIFVAISTSGGSLNGYSRNIAIAAARAKTLRIKTIGLAGKGGGSLSELADLCFVVESNTTARIQEAHAVLLHLIVEAFEMLACSPHVDSQAPLTPLFADKDGAL
jgi:D-sedoheptulose 7-phosphate isomerase